MTNDEIVEAAVVAYASALNKSRYLFLEGDFEAMRAAIAASVAAARQDERDKTIEECAKVADECSGYIIAEAIRALKG
jgi:hypothetical protein